MEKRWEELIPKEKQEERFKRWLSPPDVKFVSPEAEKTYKERVTRIIKAIKVEEPDRVPVQIPSGSFAAYYAGITLRTAMYDYEEMRRAWLKFLYDFEMDAVGGAGIGFPGRVYEALDYKTFKWPGHGLSPDATSVQYVEDDYMKADEYDAYIQNPLDYSLRFLLPRTWGVFEPFHKLPPFTSATGLAQRILAMATMPDIRAAFQTIADAGVELAKYQAVVADCARIAREAGFPSFMGGGAAAPFDHFADSLRGTRGIVMDMYRQPEKLIEAMEAITPLTIESAVAGADASGCPLIFMPLHKGDDGFMSEKQYETFYWPTFRKVLLGLINEGCVPVPIADGRYNNRLEIIKDVPRASMVWIFELTDMARAKEALGDTACIAGNVSGAMLTTGTPQQVKEYCRYLIEVCGKGGGYILTVGASIDKGNPDNLRAMIEAANEYGWYK